MNESRQSLLSRPAFAGDQPFRSPDGDFSKATVAVTIDASSIDTGVADRDAHLKSPDFFDAAQHAELRFVGNRVQPRFGSEIDVVGDLTIKGTTREVVLRVEQHGQAKDPWGNVRAAFTAKTSIDRKDFGLTWNQVLGDRRGDGR